MEMLCAVCGAIGSDQEMEVVMNNGLPTLVNYFEEFKKNDKLPDQGSVHIHKICRKNINNALSALSRTRKRKSNEISTDGPAGKLTRSHHLAFTWNVDCFFCGAPCEKDAKNPGRAVTREVRDETLKETVLHHCDDRDDMQADEVRLRLINCHSLVKKSARYHQKCRDSFMLSVENNPPAALNSTFIEKSINIDRDTSGRFSSSKRAVSSVEAKGRPIDNLKQYEFEQLCQWMENEVEMISLSEAHKKMIELAGNSEVYTRKWLKKSLETKYGEEIFFAEIDGKSNIICFKDLAKRIVTDMWYQEEKKDDFDDECRRIISAAAKLIRSAVKSAQFDCSKYPSEEDIKNVEKGKNWLPSHLKCFMESLLPDIPLNQVSFGQAIVHSLRPRSSIPPVLFGTAVQMEHVFGSKWLLKEMSALGYSMSYDEVTRFKQNVHRHERIDDYLKDYFPGSFHQWHGDNADINVGTLDGKGTFHGMGIMISSTGKGERRSTMPTIPRRKIMKVGDLIRNRGIPIIPYILPLSSGLSKISFKPLTELKSPYVIPNDTTFDLMWHAARFLRNPVPSWSGYMSKVSSGDYPGKSHTQLLPLIDLDPNNLSCIYSTLSFVVKQARHLNVKTPCMTFDLPLWQKSLEITTASSFDIVLILGGFHMMMSYMGSISTIMNGSGLDEALTTVYGKNSIPSIKSGKAVSRAIRSHFLVEAALVSKLLKPILPDITEETADIGGIGFFEPSNENETDEDYLSRSEEQDEVLSDYNENEGNERDFELDDDIEDGNEEIEMESSFEQTLLNSLSTEQMVELKSLLDQMNESPDDAVTLVNESAVLKIIQQLLEEIKEELRNSSRTARLWLQYVDYVGILKLFMRAERTGNWKLHLYAVEKMLNAFAATGHINYAKCARLYLQYMSNLHNTHPELYEQFSRGFHTVRRSDKYWAGLWTDLVIEQVMMRALKSRGGLSRGRGVSESVRLLWVNSMHRCAGIHNAMCSLTGEDRKTSEQHIELGSSRILRDNEDLNKIISWFHQHNPFDKTEGHLKSLTTGLSASDDQKINCDEAESVGLAIQRKLDNACVEDASIKRNDQVKCLDQLRDPIQINEKEKIHIDPTILFLRLTTMAQRGEDESAAFEYELTHEPTSFFKDGRMRDAKKHVLGNHLLKGSEVNSVVKNKMFCVVDGGNLLHKVQWLPNSTYKDIVQQYISYVHRNFGFYPSTKVVFDGYENGPSTKDHEHLGRGSMSSTVHVEEHLTVTVDQKAFLRNPGNKTQFIRLLCQELERHNYATIQSKGDADVLIVSTALKYATSGQDTVVWAEDTDIIVMLAYHWNNALGKMYICMQKKRKKIVTASSPKFYAVSSIVPSNAHKEHLLFAHAYMGCDTTSGFFGKGKVRILKLLKDKKMKEIASVFGDTSASPALIGEGGIQVATKLFGGRKESDKLGFLRQSKFSDMVASGKKLVPEALPPTERATYYHALRVHYQVAQWKCLDLDVLDPCEWGWFNNNGKLYPVMTDQEPAPAFLLNFIRCNCKLTSKNTCGTNMCSCRRNGLKCVRACGDCRGINCHNVEEMILEEADNE